MSFRLYYVYIMASYSRVLYAGMTNNLGNRVVQHRSDVDPNAFCTRYRIHQLVYFEEYDSVLQAIARETQIKAYRRAKKIALIDAFNPNGRILRRRISGMRLIASISAAESEHVIPSGEDREESGRL